MKQNITHIAIVVDDYDKAIEFYTKKLHFDLNGRHSPFRDKTLGFG